MKKVIEESKKRGKNETPAEREAFKNEWVAICKDLAKLLGKHAAGSPEVQKVIERHFHWISKAWTPNRDTYTGLGQGYTEFEWKAAFEPYNSHHPRLALFLAEGMKIYADKNLS